MGNNIGSPLYWTLLNHDGWNLHLAATEAGLCYVGSQDQTFEEMMYWVNLRFPNRPFIQDEDKLQSYVVELIEYLRGKRKNFSLPLDFHGTPFQLDVWNALLRIPYGHTKSYSDIAGEIQRAAAVRAVGTAIGANPVLITVPCHRVIGKNGALTGYRGGMDMKTRLLQLEQESTLG
jgi:methylated-DNA-[protein]-cysteine S-methyltransferase